MNTLTRLTAAILLLSTASLAHAARWYSVEVIVFAHNNTTERDHENWPTTTPAQLLSELRAADAVELEPAGAGGQYQTLSPSKFKLSGIWQRLANSPRYRPVSHSGWVQQAPWRGRDVLQPIVFQANLDGEPVGARPSRVPDITGTLTLSRKRYLHLDANVVMHQPATALEAYDQLTLDDRFADFSNSGNRPVTAFRLKESRRLKRGEIHYLDSPTFGLIVIANRY